MIELTWRLWINERASINYRDLLPFVQKLCAERQVDFTDDEQREAVARQMQAATFLKRDPGGEFIWMHPSFGEYFLAWKILEALREGDCRVLATRRFDRKTIGCLAPLDTARVLIEPLQRIVTGKYQKQISENALQILYCGARIGCGMEEKIENLEKLRAALGKAIPDRRERSGRNPHGSSVMPRARCLAAC
jgi:hypothetical protein